MDSESVEEDLRWAKLAHQYLHGAVHPPSAQVVDLELQEALASFGKRAPSDNELIQEMQERTGSPYLIITRIGDDVQVRTLDLSRVPVEHIAGNQPVPVRRDVRLPSGERFTQIVVYPGSQTLIEEHASQLAGEEVRFNFDAVPSLGKGDHGEVRDCEPEEGPELRFDEEAGMYYFSCAMEIPGEGSEEEYDDWTPPCWEACQPPGPLAPIDPNDGRGGNRDNSGDNPGDGDGDGDGTGDGVVEGFRVDARIQIERFHTLVGPPASAYQVDYRFGYKMLPVDEGSLYFLSTNKVDASIMESQNWTIPVSHDYDFEIGASLSQSNRHLKFRIKNARHVQNGNSSHTYNYSFRSGRHYDSHPDDATIACSWPQIAKSLTISDEVEADFIYRNIRQISHDTYDISLGRQDCVYGSEADDR
jgi:hypothetical protein